MRSASFTQNQTHTNLIGYYPMWWWIVSPATSSWVMLLRLDQHPNALSLPSVRPYTTIYRLPPSLFGLKPPLRKYARCPTRTAVSRFNFPYNTFPSVSGPEHIYVGYASSPCGSILSEPCMGTEAHNNGSEPCFGVGTSTQSCD